MTTIENAAGANQDAARANVTRLDENMQKVEQLSERLMAVLADRKPLRASLNAPNHEVFSKAATAYWSGFLQNPDKILEQQLGYWTQTIQHFVEAQHLLMAGKTAPEAEGRPKDRRFSNPMWQTHPYFNFIRQQYERNAEAIRHAVGRAEGLNDIERTRLEYFAGQIIDMLSPTNFLGTNPDVLERAVETDGQSLVDGLENLISDLEANNGELVVRLCDESAFELGQNIATTPGKVVFRNRMMELVQYTPTTDTVHAVPIVIFPPWINKFYILDLKAQNSMIKWLVEQGHTVFVVSWVNPDATMADIGMEHYIEEGYLAAFEEVKAITGQAQVNAVGYCIAGTTLNLTLALLKKRGDATVKSATFFTTLTDFSDQGEFTPFLQPDFVDGIEEEIEEFGYLRSFIMQRTFSFLRSNDLVYGPAIKSYMLGEAPPAFDLLYWNGDGSGLPGRMARQYLRGLCQDNKLADGGFELCGERLSLADVTVPICSIACETDHIARWKDCYKGVQQMGSDNKTFIVSESGHIAGIVNPPSKKKYSHYMNADLSQSAEDWMAGAEFHEGSWWPTWDKWLSSFSDTDVPARAPGDSDHPALADAPGTYVRVPAPR